MILKISWIDSRATAWTSAPLTKLWRAVLGRSTEITRIRRIPEQMPGEFRDYLLPGAPGPITVRFFQGRAVFFTVFLPQPVESPQAALQRVGIEVGAAEPDTHAPLADWWGDRTLGGKSYVKMGALKNMGGVGEGFDMVQAEFRLTSLKRGDRTQ